VTNKKTLFSDAFLFFVCSYAPITARYIKCELSEPGGGSVRAYIKEFNVYTNN
jgi:hypothetical protein